ncbi:hypothetical protein BO78DRAFT_471445 [Aspergillus sclerotiicarbonarius CBS 121057]|uniref:N-acetyltransferase domain-containing protein n=1 Tax=Aspergillus sclerotiicarbonarius (strain CBS 121057 / IBT 28362) TaxID=1448318 RepID=A0A319E255_ASPSB|nr:hypothetical protein BO78DRAFT_471445 [Aspergillus sclerotiicarbonarius CBS 121057]
MITPTTLTTPRLTLSPLTHEDVHDLHDLRNKEEVMKWSLKGSPDADLPTTQTWLTQFLSPQITPDLGPRMCYAIRITTNTTNPETPTQRNKLIGTLGIHSEPYPTSTSTTTSPSTPSSTPKEIFELGYMLHPNAWGKGYASEAVRAVVERFFSEAEDMRLLKEVREKERPGVQVEKGLFGIVNQGNEGSVGVLRKMRFQGPVGGELVEGDGRYRTMHVYHAASSR